jgi:hypothetical protein
MTRKEAVVHLTVYDLNPILLPRQINEVTSCP